MNKYNPRFYRCPKCGSATDSPHVGFVAAYKNEDPKNSYDEHMSVSCKNCYYVDRLLPLDHD